MRVKILKKAIYVHTVHFLFGTKRSLSWRGSYRNLKSKCRKKLTRLEGIKIFFLFITEKISFLLQTRRGMELNSNNEFMSFYFVFCFIYIFKGDNCNENNLQSDIPWNIECITRKTYILFCLWRTQRVYRRKQCHEFDESKIIKKFIITAKSSP